MTLHQIQSGPTTAWWYAAIPTERRGTLHVLRVPQFSLDRDRVEPPYYIVDRGISRVEMYLDSITRHPLVPGRIYGNEVAQRMCSNRQTASRWEREGWSPTGVYRGVCSDCYQWFRNNSSQFYSRGLADRHGPSSGPVIRQGGEWEGLCEAQFYGQ